MTTHMQAAPAVAYALTSITEPPVYDTAHVLLAVAALADRDLYSGNGYDGHTADEVAAVLPDTDPDDVVAALASLHLARVLDRRTTLTDDMALPLAHAFRIPQVAFDAANGEAPAPGVDRVDERPCEVAGAHLRSQRHTEADCPMTGRIGAGERPPFDDDPEGDNWAPPGVEDGDMATCRRCGQGIAWGFDIGNDGAGNPVVSTEFGFWYSDKDGTEACIPGPADEDRYHAPTTTPLPGDRDAVVADVRLHKGD